MRRDGASGVPGIRGNNGARTRRGVARLVPIAIYQV